VIVFRRRTRAATCSIANLLLAGQLSFSRAGAQISDAPSALRTLTTAHEAHSLTTAQATLGYPIRLQGVVTYFDPYIDPRHIALFVHDSTGSIFVFAPKGSTDSMPPGTMVVVTGVSGVGDFAPIVADPHVSVIGRRHIPLHAPATSLGHMMTPAEDGQWAEVEGVIRSVFVDRHNVTMQLATIDRTISATSVKEVGVDYSDLVDALVRVNANITPLFNKNRQLTGARLLFPDRSAIRIVEAATRDPFSVAIRGIDSLSRYTPDQNLPHRVHLRGRVTLQWPGSLICIRDEGHSLCAQTRQQDRVSVGDLADVIGFVGAGSSAPILTDASFRKASGNTQITPEIVTPEQALHGGHDAELVQIDGLLIGRDLVASDVTIMLASGKFIYAVILPKTMAGPDRNAWQTGSTLRVTGICSIQVDAETSARKNGEEIPTGFRILLRSPADVKVLQRPSWWTPNHASWVFAAGFITTLIVLSWVVALRRRVDNQTTAIRESEERFRHLSQHDALTGLPTRTLLRERLQAELLRAQHHQTGLAILMLDLDNFKHINDSLGHLAGDQTLCTMAERIRRNVRGSDTVARMGGDEFIVLLSELGDVKEAEFIAGNIVAALSVPVQTGNRTVPVSVSVGVCPAFGSGFEPDELLASVDAAMYEAKAQGRNRFHVFTAEMARSKVENLRLQASLREAIRRNEFEVHYQPIVNLETGDFTGIEALLRWRSKELGLIMPGRFIPLAEESELINSIGEWVLREACREIGLLERRLGLSLMLAINLSPRQFERDDLPDMIGRTLSEFGRSPGAVEFEITERMLMTDSKQIRASLKQLRNLGVSLAIDDFGVGFSSLSYISRFSVDRIKIDRSFVQKCAADDNGLVVVRAIVAMAHGLRIKVVAEGIETAEQLDILKRERCDAAQGYFFGRPVPATNLSAVLLTAEGTCAIDLGRLHEAGTGTSVNTYSNDAFIEGSTTGTDVSVQSR